MSEATNAEDQVFLCFAFTCVLIFSRFLASVKQGNYSYIN